jgi:hypothetical protein
MSRRSDMPALSRCDLRVFETSKEIAGLQRAPSLVFVALFVWIGRAARPCGVLDQRGGTHHRAGSTAAVLLRGEVLGACPVADRAYISRKSRSTLSRYTDSQSP